MKPERIMEAADRKKEIERKLASEVAGAEREVAKAEKAASAAREKLAALRGAQ
jgi:Skp family chaperone for outer membrane proteins